MFFAPWILWFSGLVLVEGTASHIFFLVLKFASRMEFIRLQRDEDICCHRNDEFVTSQSDCHDEFRFCISIFRRTRNVFVRKHIRFAHGSSTGSGQDKALGIRRRSELMAPCLYSWAVFAVQHFELMTNGSFLRSARQSSFTSGAPCTQRRH